MNFPVKEYHDNQAAAASVLVSVVNLSRATQRRKIMQEQLTKIDISARFWPAVDASEPKSHAELKEISVSGDWGNMGLHDRACTLSHLKLLEDFLVRDEAYCLILEDDVYLSAELQHWISDMSWWPENADIVKIERWRDDKLVLVLDKIETHHAGRRLAELHSRHSGGAGYFVSRAAARRIVSKKPVDMPIDHFLFNVNISPLARSLSVFQVFPALVVQGNEPKNEANSRQTLSSLSESNLPRELRRAFHELKLVPMQFWKIIARGARLRKVSWCDSAMNVEGTEIG
ncbi:MAG: glycosyltransferase family 25 protein [Paracoccaceae bacterium]